MNRVDKPKMSVYEERLRDLDKTRHKQKMDKADAELKEHKERLESARRLYEERLRDYE